MFLRFRIFFSSLFLFLAYVSYAQSPQKTGVLREAAQVPLALNGKQVGVFTAATGTKVQVLSEAEGKLLVSVAGGQVWIVSDKVDVVQKAHPVEQNPVPKQANVTTVPSKASSAASKEGANHEVPRLYPPSALAIAGETQEEVANKVIGNGAVVRGNPNLVEKYRDILVPQTKKTSCVLAVIQSCLRSSGIRLKQEELLESEIARWNLWKGTPLEVIPKFLEHSMGHGLNMEKLSAMQPTVWNQVTASKFLDEARRRLNESNFAFVSIQVGPLERHALRLLEITDDGDLVILNPRYGPTFDADEDTVDKNLLLQKWPGRWLRQPLEADLYFVRPGEMARLSANSQAWASPPSKIKGMFSSSDFLVRPGGVPQAYVIKAILRSEHADKNIDEIMAVRVGSSEKSRWLNWFHYVGDILTSLTGKKYVWDHVSELKGASYSGYMGEAQFIRDLRERLRKNEFCALEVSSGDGKKIALLLDLDSSKKVLRVLTPEEDTGQEPSNVLQEWPVGKVLATSAKFNFYTKKR